MVAVELAFASSLAKWQHEKIALHEKIKAKKSLWQNFPLSRNHHLMFVWTSPDFFQNLMKSENMKFKPNSENRHGGLG